MEIKELTLLASNLDETKRFYQQTLGFDINLETEKFLSFSIGTSILNFELTEKNKNPKYHFAFNIPSNRLEQAIDWAQKRTILIENENNSIVTDFENWNAKAIYFFDNNQNILELITREDLNNYTDEEFTINSILNINEIGLVTDQPLLISDEIIKKTKTDFFTKGPKREDFSTVGNDNGLFVISNPNRNWYPTRERAEMWKVKARVKRFDAEYELEFN